MATTVTETTTGGETVTGGGSTTTKTLYDSSGYPSGLVTTTVPSTTTYTPATAVDPNKIADIPIAKTDEDVRKGYKVEITGIGEITKDDASPPPNSGHQGQSTITVGEDTPPKTDAATTSNELPPITEQKVAPGARPYNPLAGFASYNYHITLYMITPYTYNKYIEQGNKGLPPTGMYIVAESAGTNVGGLNKRLFDLDYYIDDFSFDTFLSTNANKGANVDSIGFNFKIYEPFGFSFMSRLKAAAATVVKNSDLPGQDGATSYMQQMYMIGIKFYGYDINGDLISDNTMNQLVPNRISGTDALPIADAGVFARYFPVKITELQFKLDGKVTVYNFKAANVSVNTGNGAARNMISTKQSISGKTVEELLITSDNSLVNVLNKIQEDSFTKKTIGAKNIYKIRFKNPNSVIKDSLLALGDTGDRNQSPVSGALPISNTSDINDKNAQKVKPDNSIRTFEIAAGQSITQTIEKVIAQSSFITDALTAKGVESFDDWSEEAKSTYNSGNKATLQWFIITPVTKILEFDTVIKDYAYETTYIINEYKTPRVRSVYVSEPEKYYGAHKIYEYYFTGKNSEILSYEQKYNGLYFIDALENPKPGKALPNNKGLPTPVVTNRKQNADDSSLFDKAGQIIGSVRTNLYSPADQVMASMQIMGDPDFICTTIGMNYDIYDDFYGPDKSIDPHAGQVFVQIIFNEGVDYEHETGLMKINTDITLYEYPKYLKGTKGIIYSVNTCSSTFSKGRFTQELQLVMFAPPDDPPSKKSETARETISSAEKDSAPIKGFTTEVADNENEGTSSQPASAVQTADSGTLQDTNNGIISRLTGGRVQVANETTLASVPIEKVVQGPLDDNSGIVVSSNIENEGRMLA